MFYCFSFFVFNFSSLIMVVRDSFHNFHVNAASFQSEALADLDKLCTDRHSARSGAQNL